MKTILLFLCLALLSGCYDNFGRPGIVNKLNNTILITIVFSNNQTEHFALKNNQFSYLDIPKNLTIKSFKVIQNNNLLYTMNREEIMKLQNNYKNRFYVLDVVNRSRKVKLLPHVDKIMKRKECQKFFVNINNIKKRNKQILKALGKGCPQHIIAKVLGVSQETIHAVVKKSMGFL